MNSESEEKEALLAIRDLYKARCEATIEMESEGEELFLADLSEILEKVVDMERGT